MKKGPGFGTRVQMSWSLTQNAMGILMKKEIWFSFLDSTPSFQYFSLLIYFSLNFLYSPLNVLPLNVLLSQSPPLSML